MLLSVVGDIFAFRPQKELSAEKRAGVVSLTINRTDIPRMAVRINNKF
jgi:hypothetical protein